MSNPYQKGDKVQLGSTKGTFAETLTRDTVVNGQKIEASAANPKVRIVTSSGSSTVADPKQITKRT